jgi:hypothetical protein
LTRNAIAALVAIGFAALGAPALAQEIAVPRS